MRKKNVDSLTYQPLVVIDYRGEIIAVYRNSVQAEELGGFSGQMIRRCLNGKSKLHKGFKFVNISVEEYDGMNDIEDY